MKEIMISYMKQIHNQPDFTELVILVHGTESKPTVKILKAIDESQSILPMNGAVSRWFPVELPKSNSLHQITINPELCLLGNILIRFPHIFEAYCDQKPYSENPDLQADIQLVSQYLHSGYRPEERDRTYGWAFISSCLSRQFAKQAFLEDPKSKTRLQYMWYAGVGIATASACVVPGLNLLGWGSNGVLANSYAAQIQSGMGCVAKGSLFAKLQSVAATGGPAFNVFSALGAGAARIASQAGDHLRGINRTPYLYLYSDGPTYLSTLGHQLAKQAFLGDSKLKTGIQYMWYAGVGIATASACALPRLNFIGWGSKGVLANSYAAQIQSGMGCVAKGSLFAKFQSVAATGGPAFNVFSALGAGAARIANQAGDHLRGINSTPYLYLYSDDPTDLSTLERLIDCEGFYYANDK